MLAGFWGRKSEGHPGAKLVGQGLLILSELVNFRRLCDQADGPTAVGYGGACGGGSSVR